MSSPSISHAVDSLPMPALTLTADQWPSPINGQSVAMLPPLAAAMQDMIAAPDSRLALRHPRSDEGNAWAQELRDWLVSLGVSSDRIEMIPAAPEGVIGLAVSAAAAREAASAPGKETVAPFPAVEPSQAEGVEVP
ncbi:MAG: hypothetical protein IDH49_08945 [Gammaproteobacteria bacterium]|nr:hypothetical protein [Gammaproteobacteria bacterium]